MKKIISILIAIALLFSLANCGEKITSDDDDEPVTMFISLGNGEAYYTKLAELIKNQLDIDVKFIYQINCNTTESIRLSFKNNCLPADIVFTASKTDDAILKDCCVDLLSRSSVTAKFSPITIQNCTTEDGAIYQLPVSSKLIGITYNETLLTEMGWDVPETYNDMVDLKAKCDEAGVKFAVFDSLATGHGFNWLFHLMGAQWLSTPDGTDWFQAFRKGERSVDEFKEKCLYFKDWTEAGLWGARHADDWNGVVEFQKTRALFWFGLTNGSNGYEGPMFDDNGVETGRMLNDTYKTIPWISQDGSNNCFTYYDCSWVYVNKSLEAPENSLKFEKAMKIIDYLTSEDATELVSEVAKDTYVSVNNYEIGDDRIYAHYNENIKNGFIQPWYYSYFDSDSINYTGAAVNEYLAGSGSFDNIFDTLDKYNKLHLNNQTEIIANFSEALGYEDTAKLVALSAAAAVDLSLEENGIEDRVSVVLAPYTPDVNMLQPWRAVSVCNSVVYKGALDGAAANYIFPADCVVPLAVYMTGAEIKAIVDKEYNPSDWFTNIETGASSFDSEHYGPYPYICLVKNGAELIDDNDYLVAMCRKFVSSADYKYLEEKGHVLLDIENMHTMLQGLEYFSKKKGEINTNSLVF